MKNNRRLRNLALYICYVVVFASLIGAASCAHDEAADKVIEPLVAHEQVAETKNETASESSDAADIPTEIAVEIEPEMPKGTYLGTFTITHYCPYRCCNGKWAGKTASGATPVPWYTISVDKRKIPMGSKIHIEGYGDFVAQDCGGLIKGNRIDVLVGSHAEALSLGVKRMEVYLL